MSPWPSRRRGLRRARRFDRLTDELVGESHPRRQRARAAEHAGVDVETVYDEHQPIGEGARITCPGMLGQRVQTGPQILDVSNGDAIGGMVLVAELRTRGAEGAAPVVRGGHLAGHGAHDGHELASGIVGMGKRRLFHDGRPFPLATLEVSDDELVLAGELAVQELLSAAALVDDLLRTHCPGTVLLEKAHGAVKDAVPRSGCRLACHRTASSRLHDSGTDRSRNWAAAFTRPLRGSIRDWSVPDRTVSDRGGYSCPRPPRECPECDHRCVRWSMHPTQTTASSWGRCATQTQDRRRHWSGWRRCRSTSLMSPSCMTVRLPAPCPGSMHRGW